jgi:hypothetical protein
MTAEAIATEDDPTSPSRAMGTDPRQSTWRGGSLVRFDLMVF